MRIGNIEINFKKPDEVLPPVQAGKEISWADSAYYDAYQLRPYNPDTLYQKKGDYSLYDDIREDDQVFAALSLKKLITLNADWEIDCENPDIKDFLEANLNWYLDDIFSKNLFEILSALDYGNSITEKIFAYENTKWGNKIILKTLKTRAPHTFEIHTDLQGNIEFILQHTGTQGDLKLDPKKFILYSYQKEFDNWYGRSEINKGVYTAWWSKTAIIKFWNIRLEKFAQPLMVGKLPRGNPPDKDRFLQVMKNVGSRTAITIPADFEIELKEAAKGTDEYERAIDKYNTMIARKMLLPDLLGFSGAETGGGSYALGEKQFEIFYTSVEYIRTDLERLINKEIIQPLVQWNYGSNQEAFFKWAAIDEARKSEDLKMWLDAVKSGKLPVTNEHINWFLSQVNAPEISEKELQAIEEEKQAFKNNMLNNGEEKDDDRQDTDNTKQSDDNVKPVDKDKGVAGKVEKEKGDEAGERVRESSKPDKKEFVKKERLEEIVYTKNDERTEKGMDDIEGRYVERLGAEYKLMINALVNEIKVKKIIEKKRIDLISNLKLKHTNKTLKSIKDLYKEAWKLGIDTFELQEFAIVEDVQLLTEAEYKTLMDEYANFVNSGNADEILQLTRNALYTGIKEGMSVKEIVTTMETALAGYDTSLDPVKIQRMVRTSITEVFNDARNNLFDEAGDRIIGYRFNAILDGLTSRLCQSLHGKFIKPSERAYYQPPLHFNCRSKLQGVIDTIDEKDLKAALKIPANAIPLEVDKWGMKKLVK